MAAERKLSVFSLVWWPLFFCNLHSSVSVSPISLLCTINSFDYFNLTAMTWFLDLKQPQCLAANNGSSPPSQCRVILGICHRLEKLGPCNNSSVCLTSDQGDLNLGGYAVAPFHIFDTHHTLDGFQADFPNGESYTTANNVSCELQTVIDFNCNKSAYWLTSNVPQEEKKAPDPISVTYDESKCQMNLTFAYAGACKRQSSSVETMSAGTVLICIFFVTLIFYFVFGALINKARGRSGTNVIPHANFWGMLPVYIIDGFQFVLCCGRQPVTQTYDKI